MQVLTIAVQNTVDYADLGTATSGVTFFRTLGGAFGTAVFGTIYTNALTPDLTVGHRGGGPDGRRATRATIARGGAESRRACTRCPRPRPSRSSTAYADALQTVFMWTMPVAVLGFVVSLFLKQVRLRDSARVSSTDMGEGFASPTGDSQCLLETAVGRIIRGTEADTMRRIVAESGTRLDVAGAWAVIQVDLAARHFGNADLEAIAARGAACPPEVLEPVFDRMVADGLLTRDGWVYDAHGGGPPRGRADPHGVGQWLEQRVEQDIGRPPGTDLRAAVETIAKRLLTEDERLPALAGRKV